MAIISFTRAQSVKACITNYPFNKFYEYRVYDGASYVKSWTAEVLSEPTFRMVINGGAGEMVIRLGRKFDDFGEDVDVKLFNKVEVWCYDRDAINGTMIYSGFISGYRPVLDGHSEYIEVTLLPYLVECSNIMLRSGSDTQVSYSSQDPADILKDIIDKYRSDGGEIEYTVTSVDNCNTTVSYTFNCYTIKEALDKVIELTPENWYWRIDADDIIHLHLSSMSDATHDFVIGKHVNYMETWRRAEDLINRVYFIGQESAGVPMYRVYSNTSSIEAYGIHVTKKVDQRVALTSSADIISNRIINSKEDPEIRTTLVVVDNNGSNHTHGLGYDIESIKPGDTMRIRNIKHGVKTISLWDVAMWDVDVWDQTLAYSAADVIQILAVEYTPNLVRLEASSRLPEISKRMEDIYRNVEETQTWNTPATPTEG